MKTGVLLINLGTPDSPSTSDVRTYLSEFLNDPRVIDIPYLSRKLLVNMIIVPFRGPKSAKLYQEIWTEKGSPLLLYGLELKDKLQESLGKDFVVDFGMRYRKPGIEPALDRLRAQKVKKIIVIPLYPQYSSSTTGSTIQKLMEIICKWEVIPNLEIISDFYTNEGFVDAFAEIGSKYDHQHYDHVIFSYHGLPERQVLKASAHYGDNYCQLGACCNKINNKNHFCYRASCFETSRRIAQKLNIPADKYTITFQSRLGKDPWIKPYSDDVIEELGKKGVKKLLVFSPAFVADCLETIHEIGVEYLELFKEHGGEELQLVESLNVHPKWVEVLKNLVLKK